MLNKRLLLLLVFLGACAKMSPKDATSAPMQMRESPPIDQDQDAVADPELSSQNPMSVLESQIQRDLASLGISSELYNGLTIQAQPGATAGSYGFSTGNNVNPTAKQPQTVPPPGRDPKSEDKSKGKDDQYRKENKDGEGKKAPIVDTTKTATATEDSCQKTCALVENICKASDKICEIADRLPKDSDAPQRCQKAKNACERAKDQGSSCSCSS